MRQAEERVRQAVDKLGTEASIRAIAREAGVAKSTVQRYIKQLQGQETPPSPTDGLTKSEKGTLEDYQTEALDSLAGDMRGDDPKMAHDSKVKILKLKKPDSTIHTISPGRRAELMNIIHDAVCHRNRMAEFGEPIPVNLYEDITKK